MGDLAGPPGDRDDLIGTGVLALAALATAYASLQSSQWDGEQARHAAEGSASFAEASRLSSLGGAELTYDSIAVIELALAHEHGDQGYLARVEERVIRPEFAPYVERWRAMIEARDPDVPATPLGFDDFHNTKLDGARAATARGDEALRQAALADDTGDRFERVNLALGMVLFLAALAPKPRRKVLRRILLGTALLLLTLAMVALLSIPRP